MRFRGTWAAHFIREIIVPDFRAFADVVTKRLLPTFESFGTEALKHGEEWFRARAGHLDPLDDQQYEAASYFADKAMDETSAFADMLVSMYFASTAIYTVGLFHLLEQHAKELHLRLLDAHSYNKEIRLTEVTHWLRAEASVDVETSASWPIINQLRLVANVIKHAEGHSAAQLRLIRPELFFHPSERQGAIVGKPLKSRIRKPLFGEDLYLTSSDFSGYSEAVVVFWSELADAMSLHA